MTKDEYKESCGRIGVPFFEEDFYAKQQDYIKSLMEKEKPTLGVKFDRNKPMWSLVPPGPMEEVVEVQL